MRRRLISVATRLVGCAALSAQVLTGAAAAAETAAVSPQAAPMVIVAPPPEDLTAAPPSPSEEVTVYLVMGIAHADLVIPRWAFADAPRRVRTAVANAPPGDWVMMGWGPYWFGRKPSGGIVRSTVVRAWARVVTLTVPQHNSQVRLDIVASLAKASEGNGGVVLPLHMTAAGLASALRRIDATFEVTPEGDPVLADQTDAQPGAILYQSGETYSLAHQCNNWLAEVLRAGGVNVPPLLELAPASLGLGVVTAGKAGKARDEAAPPAVRAPPDGATPPLHAAGAPEERSF